MSDLYESLKAEFQDSEYRYGYAESFLNTKLATQIKTLREQRGKTQVEMGALMGIKQPGYRRFEDINHSVWKTDTLWNIARALGVRVDISFKTFGSLLDDKKSFTKELLELPEFAKDPAFTDQVKEPEEIAVAEKQPATVSLASTTVSPEFEHGQPVAVVYVHPNSAENFTLIIAAPELLAALKSLDTTCSFDGLNPCWDNRPTDKPGLHWGSEPDNPVPACPGCIAQAAIAKAEGKIR